MVTVRIFTGMGNQMFQYAAGRHLSLLHGCELRLDVAEYQNRWVIQMP